MNRMNRLLWLPLILCALLAAVGCGCQPFSPKNGTTTTPPTTTAPPTVYVTVIADGATDYTVIRPARSQYADISTVVSGIREAASAQLGVSSLRVNSDAAAEAAHEILVGDITRAATVAAAARLAAAQDEASYHWLVAEDHGKIVLYADSDVG